MRLHISLAFDEDNSLDQKNHSTVRLATKNAWKGPPLFEHTILDFRSNHCRDSQVDKYLSPAVGSQSSQK